MAKKILLADDSMTIQKVVELTFMDQDYEVAAVSDGTSAIEWLGTAEPDIVIADVHMPGADGYAVCRHSKAKWPGTPVLLLVGTFEQFDEQQANQAGADDHLKKPFDSQELLQKVDALVADGGSAPPVVVEEPDLSTQLAAPRPMAPEPSAPPFAAPPAVPEVSAPEPMAPAPAVPEPFVPEPAAPEPEPEPVVELLPEPAFQASPAETRPRRVEQPEEVAVPAAASNGSLSDADIERIARKVLDLAGDRVLKQVAWEVIPDLAEVVVRERILELESDVE